MKICSVRNAALSTLLSLVTFGGLLSHYGTQPMTTESLEDADWIASSRSWIDRTACRTFGLCGLAHSFSRARWKSFVDIPLEPPKHYPNNTAFWESGGSDPVAWSAQEYLMREIPQYVLDHAPYVHLFSKEEFWPGDMPEHLAHTTPHLNYTPVDDKWRYPDLMNLAKLNKFGRFTFLKSDDNVETRPDWLGGETNIPSAPAQPIDEQEHFPGIQGHWRWHPSQGVHEDPDLDKWWHAGIPGHEISEMTLKNQTDPESPSLPKGAGRFGFPQADEKVKEELRKRQASSAGGRSDAPVILITVDKGHGVVDAFWFYFYSYNLGNKVFGIRFGNHVGDWEHTVVRFYNGQPKAVFFSEHDMGAAYSWNAVEKIGKRPVSYSAVGTHAMYATPGVHTYVLPFGLLHDITDRGPLWDPVLNLRSYTYDYETDTLRSSTLNPKAPTNWFYFWGHWGDKFYPLSDPRQYRFAGQYHYVNGPLGPRFKRLGRKRICQGGEEETCRIRYWIGGLGERISVRLGVPLGHGEDHNLNDEEARRALANGRFGL